MSDIVKNLTNAKFSRQCTLCGEKVRFSSIESELGNMLGESKFPYGLDAFETLSYRTYECPVCKASDRDRLYKLYIDRYENFTRKSKILDFAPSRPLAEYLKRKKASYRSADLFMSDVDDRVDIMDMNIYKSRSFDFFLCSHILEHVDDDNRALSELHRILKVGGRGIVMTPIINQHGVQDEDPKVISEKERWQRFAQGDHVRLYEKEIFLHRVKGAGFKVRTYGFWNLGIANMIRNGISLRSRLYVVERVRS